VLALALGEKGGAYMDQRAIRLHLPSALQCADIRHACLAVERAVSTIDLLDSLSPAALECVRDYCDAHNKCCRGKFSEFKRAYLDLVIEHLSDVRLHERRLYQAITGEDVQEANRHYGVGEDKSR
jgi:hypothetical protein